jgi:hypothetical protein
VRPGASRLTVGASLFQENVFQRPTAFSWPTIRYRVPARMATHQRKPWQTQTLMPHERLLQQGRSTTALQQQNVAE